MNHIATALVGLLSVAAAPVLAADLRPAQAIESRIGDYSLLSYYVEQGQDLKVITTAVRLGAEDGSVIRFTSMLRDGQSTEFSVPRNVGEPALSVRLSRVGNHVELANVGE